jgi:hypothetical protein
MLPRPHEYRSLERSLADFEIADTGDQFIACAMHFDDLVRKLFHSLPHTHTSRPPIRGSAQDRTKREHSSRQGDQPFETRMPHRSLISDFGIRDLRLEARLKPS